MVADFRGSWRTRGGHRVEVTELCGCPDGDWCGRGEAGEPLSWDAKGDSLQGPDLDLLERFREGALYR